MKGLMWFTTCLLAFIVGVNLGAGHATGSLVTMKDSVVVVHDTVKHITPAPLDGTIVVKTITVKVPVADTVINTVVDSVLVYLPIEQKEYRDTNYRAWVSGYKANLDSLYVFPETVYVTRYIKEKATKKWGLGVQAGVGSGYMGVTPYVGVGVSYNLFSW